MLELTKATAALLNGNERLQVLLIALCMLVSVLLETLGVGFIFPLVKLLIAPQSLFDWRILRNAYRISGVAGPRQFLALCACVFLLLIVLKSLYNTFLTAWQERLCHRISARIGALLMAQYLRAPWRELLQRNSAELINVADVMTGWPLTNALRGYPVIATEGLVSAGLLILLFYVAPYPALIAIGAFGAAMFITHSFVRRRLVALSRENAQLGGARIQFLQQSLASIKEIRILGRESRFVDEYAQARDCEGSVLSRLMTWQHLPRAFVEPLAVGAMTAAIVVVSLRPVADLAQTTAVLGLFSVAGIRLTPSLTRMLVAINGIRASSEPLARIQRDLEWSRCEESPHVESRIPALRGAIRGHSLTYRYPTASHSVLRDVSFSIHHGTTVGFMGASGAGKSTLADIIVGLLTPDHGTVEVDGVDIATDKRGWQRQIGYIPQSVSLIDASLSENIALGLRSAEIDDAQMQEAVSLARLDGLIDKLPQGLDTRLGERGIRLSGGERQRIGIARALYHRRGVLVMDEATSALDSETETEIGAAIARMHGQFTILIIAHRQSTLRRCDQVMVLKEGRIIDSGLPADMEKRYARQVDPLNV